MERIRTSSVRTVTTVQHFGKRPELDKIKQTMPVAAENEPES